MCPFKTAYAHSFRHHVGTHQKKAAKEAQEKEGQEGPDDNDCGAGGEEEDKVPEPDDAKGGDPVHQQQVEVLPSPYVSPTAPFDNVHYNQY